MARGRITRLKDGMYRANFLGAFAEYRYSMKSFPTVVKIGKRAKLFDCEGKLLAEEDYWYIKAMECEIIKEIEKSRKDV